MAEETTSTTRTDTDYIYGLDGEHIRQVALAATTDAPILNVTAVANRIHLTGEWSDEALAALRRVGYQAHVSPGGASPAIEIAGWSERRLESRNIFLQLAAARLTNGLYDIPGEAVDAYVTREKAPDIDAPRYQAAQTIRTRLRHDVETVTGPRVAHDPGIMPRNPAVRHKLTRSWEREHDIEDLIARHWMLACDAIDAYAERRVHGGRHDESREYAIVTVHDMIAENKRLYWGARTVDTDAEGHANANQADSASVQAHTTGHPAALADSDQPVPSPTNAAGEPPAARFQPPAADPTRPSRTTPGVTR